MQVLRSDAIVVGGGLEGALLALELRRTGESVTLIDRARPRAPETPYDRWLASPFLYPEWAWRRVSQSRFFWEEWGVWQQAPGAALAGLESPSWSALREAAELRDVPLRTMSPDDFPELNQRSLGSIFVEHIPWLDVSSLMLPLWQQLEREGVRLEADRQVSLVDWEHDLPTAVAGDTIYRGRRLFLCAGKQTEKLLKIPLPKLAARQLWLEGNPQIEPGLPRLRPSVWIHYAKAPLSLNTETARWGCVRLHDYADEREELQFVREARQRWLSCGFAETQVHELTVPGWEDGQPILDQHPWRDDCWWLAGVGQTHWPWLPSLLHDLADRQGARPAQLALSRTVAAAADS